MESSTARHLLRLNRAFYARFANEFAFSRAALQPGIQRALARLGDFNSLLDVGCGDGRLMRALADAGRAIDYVGVDFSGPMIELARSRPVPGSVTAGFLQAEIASQGWASALPRKQFDCAVLLAVLHHIPGARRRARLLRQVAARVRPGGRIALSVWQFLSDEKLRRKIVPWSRAGLGDADVDAGDYLLDWKRGGEGLRYCHLLTEEDITSMARSAGCEVVDTYRSDGRTGALSRYAIMQPVKG